MEKLVNLKQQTRDLSDLWSLLVDWFPLDRSVLVAFSGGVDSTLVLKAASIKVPSSQLLAITADSPSLPRRELEEVRNLSDLFGVKLRLLKTKELQNPDYQKNDSSRCFHCKSELFLSLEHALKSPELQEDLLKSDRPALVVDGLNQDDLSDERPGRKAAERAGVRHPLVELGITKQEIRQLAKMQDLPNFDKPAMACLSSRIARGVVVNQERLSLVERAEEILYDHGYRGMRVRLHALQGSGDESLARIELQEEDLERFLRSPDRKSITSEIKNLGFTFLTLDVEGYKKGGFAKPKVVLQKLETT